MTKTPTRYISTCRLALTIILMTGVKPATGDDLGFTIIPVFKTVLGYDTNIFRAPHHQQCSKFLSINPSLTLQTTLPQTAWQESKYSLSLNSDSHRYLNAREADYTDVAASIDMCHFLDDKSRIAADFTIAELHNTCTPRRSHTPPPEYRKYTTNIFYTSHLDRINTELEVAGTLDKRQHKLYKTRQSNGTWGATFYHPIFSKTQAIVELNKRSLLSDSNSSANVGTNKGFYVTNYLIGINWEIAGHAPDYPLINGDVRWGRRYRDAKSPGPNNSKHYPGWQVTLSYLPCSCSQLQLISHRDYNLIADPEPSACFTNGTQTTLIWRHNWLTYIKSDLSWSVTHEQLQDQSGSAIEKRKTDTIALNITLDLGWQTDSGATISFGHNRQNRHNSFSYHTYQVEVTLQL